MGWHIQTRSHTAGEARIMNPTKYAHILLASFRSFIEESYSEHHWLYQDDDLIRTFGGSLNQGNCWKSPAVSPDLYPIEKVCGSQKTYFRDKHNLKNVRELMETILTYRKLTPEMCTRHLNHMQKVMPVVQEQGAHSGHWNIFCSFMHCMVLLKALLLIRHWPVQQCYELAWY